VLFETLSGTSLALLHSVGKQMNADRTKLAVRVTVAGLRSAKDTGEKVGGPRGKEITQTAKARAAQILDQIDEQGTDADDERQAARRELKSH
jgi:hypothetical protein